MSSINKRPTAREIRFTKKFCFVIYRHVKRKERTILYTRDRFFGTGITIYIWLKI